MSTNSSGSLYCVSNPTGSLVIWQKYVHGLLMVSMNDMMHSISWQNAMRRVIRSTNDRNPPWIGPGSSVQHANPFEYLFKWLTPMVHTCVSPHCIVPCVFFPMFLLVRPSVCLMCLPPYIPTSVSCRMPPLVCDSMSLILYVPHSLCPFECIPPYVSSPVTKNPHISHPYVFLHVFLHIMSLLISLPL